MFDVLHLLLERFRAKVGLDSLQTLLIEILPGRTTDRDRLDQLWYDAQVKSVLSVKSHQRVLNVSRKDDPAALRNFILNVQSKASKADIEDSRVLFMIEVLNGIKNNNVNKIPNYDPSHFEHLKKSLKSSLREGKFVTELNISYKDLIQVWD